MKFVCAFVCLSFLVGAVISQGCQWNQFRCSNNGRCIPRSWICDNDNDCGNWADEQSGCSSTRCTSNQFRCDTGRCIPFNWRCDRDNDCGDGSDEQQCSIFRSLIETNTTMEPKPTVPSEMPAKKK